MIRSILKKKRRTQILEVGFRRKMSGEANSKKESEDFRSNFSVEESNFRSKSKEEILLFGKINDENRTIREI